MAKRGINPSSKKKPDTTDTPTLTTDHLPFPQTSSFKLIRPGVWLFRNNFEASVVILIIPALLLRLGDILAAGTEVVSTRVAIGAIVTLTAGTWLVLNMAVNYYFQLRVISGDRVGILESYRHGIRFLPRLFGLAILSGIVVGVGLLLFIVPGVIAFRRYFLAPYFLVDNDIGIREAMQLSAAATKPVKGYVWSALAVLLAFAVISYLLEKHIAVYGGVLAILLTGLYVYVPALRYMEIARRRSALAIKD